MVEPIAAGLAGLALLLLLGPAGQDVPGLTLLLLALLAAWLLLGRRLGRLYRATLAQALNAQRIVGAAFSLKDSSTRAVVLRSLQSPQPGEVRYALELLERDEDVELPVQLGALLGHPTPEVRRDALTRIERLRPAELLPAVRALLAVERDALVLEPGLRALAALGEDEACDELRLLLDAPSLPVRRGAMVGLLRSGGIGGVLAAGERLLRFGSSPHAAERAFAAEVLGGVARRSFYQPLLPCPC